MALRTGKQYLDGLRDGRRIIYDGEVISDVTTAPGFAATAKVVANFYDFQQLPEMRDVMTYAPGDGERAGMSFIEPRSREDLRRRSAAWTVWADVTCGFMGRSPDYMATCLSALSSIAAHLGKIDPRLAESARRLYLKGRQEDLCYTHTFIQPFANRAEATHPSLASIQNAGDRKSSSALSLTRTSTGSTITGARGLATLAPFADANLNLTLEPQTEPDGTPFMSCFVHPVSGKGMSWVCRDIYSANRTPYESPLAGRFDELDCIGIYDNVHIPSEDTFVDVRGADTVKAVAKRLRVIISEMKHHNLIRSVSKARFVFGLAHLVAESSQVSTFANVKEVLGEMVHSVQMAEALAMGAIEGAEEDPETGIWHPHAATAQLAGTWFGQAYPQMVTSLMELAGGRVVSTIQEKTLDVLGDSIEKYFRGSASNAKENLSLFRLAWDVSGSEWGARQSLYERFNVGSATLRRMTDYAIFDKARSIEMVRRVLRGE